MKWQQFFEIQDGGGRHLEFVILRISYVIDMFHIEIPVFPLILMTIGQIVKKWQPFFEIQDGGNRHLEFDQQCISDVIDVPTFSLMLVTIGQIVKKWQQFCAIQVGGDRNLELWLLRFFDVTEVI